MIEFTDYKTLVDTHAKNWTYDTEGERVKWTDMRVIVLNKAEPSIVSFKCNYNDADFRKININARLRGTRVSGTHPEITNTTETTYTQIYHKTEI